MWHNFPNSENLKFDQSLAEYTTLGVGGKAEAVFIASSIDLLEKALVYSYQHNIRPIILGGGSNVLISDKPINGLVIINRCQNWQEIESEKISPISAGVQPRWQSAEKINSNLPAASNLPIIRVRVESGCLISRLMLELLDKEITGLEWFAGIPGSVGGAIFTNMHGGNNFFGNLVESARLFSNGKVMTVKNDYFKFKYDWSVLFDTHEIVLDAILQLRRGPVLETRKFIADWIKKKNESQEKKSCGCIFQNLSAEEQTRLNLPTPSAGYVVDRLLDLKGKQIGQAKISDIHGNFMVNLGGAKAEDFAILIAYVKEQARNKLGLQLKEEIEYIGFN